MESAKTGRNRKGKGKKGNDIKEKEMKAESKDFPS